MNPAVDGRAHHDRGTTNFVGWVRVRSAIAYTSFFKPRGLRCCLATLRSSLPAKKGSRTPTDASFQPLHLTVRRAVQSAHACRRSTAALARETLVPKAQRQATLPETRPERLVLKAAPTGGRRPRASPRVLPAPSCHRPASTSRAGHSAGRVMPKPPGSKGDEPLPAGTATSLPPTAVTWLASFTESEVARLLPSARLLSSIVAVQETYP
jgi:hypothetical protein